MELDPTFFAFAIPAVILAGISKGGFGSGAAFAATPFLALILEPEQAVALMLPLLMVIDGTSLKAWWGKWDREAAKILILAGTIGTGLGAVLFSVANPQVLKLMIGLIAIGFVVFQLIRAAGWLKTPETPPGRGAGMFWGTIGGITSFISHAGGPPVTIYLLGQRLSKAAYQGTTVVLFAVLNAEKFVVFGAMGLFDTGMIIAVMVLAPVAIAGTYLGVWAHRRISERAYYTLIYVFLVVTGSKLIYDVLI